MLPKIVEFSPSLGTTECSDRVQVIDYLSCGTVLMIATERMTDPLHPDSGRSYGFGLVTDGRLIWNVAILELLEDYPTLSVPSELVEAVKNAPTPTPVEDDRLIELLDALGY